MQVTPEQFDQAAPQQRVGGARPSPLGQLWEGLKRDFSQIPAVAKAKTPQIGRDIAEGATGLARDVGQSLNPLASGRESAGAAGRVLGKVGDVAALATGGFAGPTMPPAAARVPRGTMQATPAMRASAERIAGAAEEATAPSLISNMVKGDTSAIDRTLIRQYKSAVRPPKDKAQTIYQLDARNRQVIRAIDNIIANRDQIDLTKANGAPEPKGQTPANLYQFGEAVQGLRRHLYNQFESMEQRAGGAGVRVPVQPAIDAMMQIADNPDLQAARPAITETARRLAESWTKRGPLKPTEAGDTIKTLNRQLTDPNEEILRPAINVLRKSTDDAIMGAAGPGYQPLKNQYGDLLSIEKHVVGAAARDMAQNPGILEKYGNFAAIAEALTGLMAHEPRAFVAAAATKGAQMMVKYLHSPNRAVRQLFNRRANQGQMIPLSGSALPGGMGLAQGVFAAGQSDTGPNGGRIIARTPVQ